MLVFSRVQYGKSTHAKKVRRAWSRSATSQRDSQSRAMRRTGSMQDVKAFVKHFPEHLSWRAERESFAHEAAQYALWVPFALVAKQCGFETLSYLFATWFVLGEAMLVYMHASTSAMLRALRWWHVVGAIAIVGVVVGVPVRRTFGRFVMEYVFFGALVMACVFPLIPKAFRRDVPDMIYALGFLKKRTD